MFIKKRKVLQFPEYHPANYDTALDYLIGLSPDEYHQVLQVVAIHRQANYDSAKVLGEELKPTTFIDSKKPKLSETVTPFLDFDKKGKVANK